MAKAGITRVEKHGVVSRVQVLEYGDDPAVEPGDVAVRKLNDELPRFVAWLEFQADGPGWTEQPSRHVLKIGRGGRSPKPHRPGDPGGRATKEAAVEPMTTDRVQRMIDAEAAGRFPPGAVPRLVLLHHGDHPFIEPGELYLLVILGQDGAARDAWWAEHSGRLEEFRAQRLPEVKGFMVTTGARDSAGRPPTQIRQPTGISLLDPDEDEIARGLAAVTAHFGPVDLATLDTLITAGIAVSRADAVRWALARIREQPAYGQLSERARKPGEPRPRAVLDRAVLDQLQSRLGEQMKEHFPDGGVQRVALLQHGDDPSVEPGDLLARVSIEEAGGNRDLPEWHRDHEAMIRELQHELEEKSPGASRLEFWFGENGRRGKSPVPGRTDPAASKQDLIPAHIGLGPADLEMLDALITAGTAASRAEAVSWVLARIRERPAYARLSERAGELDQLKAHF